MLISSRTAGRHRINRSAVITVAFVAICCFSPRLKVKRSLLWLDLSLAWAGAGGRLQKEYPGGERSRYALPSSEETTAEVRAEAFKPLLHTRHIIAYALDLV